MKKLLMKLRGKGPRPEPTTDNPYFNARLSWNLYVAPIVEGRRFKDLLCAFSMLIALVAVAENGRIGAMSKFIPVFLERGDNGEVHATRGDKVEDALLADYRTAVNDFIISQRTVTADADLQRKMIFKVYSMLAPNDAATAQVTQFYSGGNKSNGKPTFEFYTGGKDSSPFARAADETVTPSLNALLRVTDQTWQVDWTETIRSREGEVKDVIKLRALVTVYQNKDAKMDDSQLINNGHKIFVKDQSLSKQL